MKALLEFLWLKEDVYQLKEILSQLSPEAGYSASKGSVEKVDP